MQGFPQSIALDLDRYSESTRRRLYQIVGASNFSGLPQEPGDTRLPYTAEEAGLSVLFVHGRWLAIWTRLEVESYRPARERIEVLRIRPTTENDLGIMLHEC